jgi:acetyltransferase-like isoleucine patch superfamily enzyme
VNDIELESLVQQAREVYERAKVETRRRWNRDLPIEELIFDRWERARDLGFGDGSSIYHNSYVFGDVKVGSHTWIGPLTLLDGSGGLTIGSYCSISTGVQIYTHDTVKWALSGGKAGPDRAPVKVGDCCYIGSQTVITKGVTIGDHCAVSACSLVNRDLPPYTIAFGIPCRPMGRIEISGSGEVTLILNTQLKGRKTQKK